MTDESLIREVDEEVRQDEYKKIWDRYGNLFVGLAALVLAAVAGFEGWKYYQRTEAERAGIVFAEAVEKAKDGKFDDAIAAFKAVKHDGYGQLARLREAAVLAEKGETDKAVAAFDAIAADAANLPAIADLARIRAGYALVDTQSPADLQKRLGGLDDDSAVWRHQAREIVALSAYRIGDMALADKYLNLIFLDADTPDAMRQRAQMLIQLIQPKLPKK